MDLKLKNTNIILSVIEKYALDINIDFLSLMELFCKIITKEHEDSIHLDNVLFDLKNILKKDTIWETEEELYHVISYELNKKYSDLILNNADKKDIDNVFIFLNNNYFEIFKPYYDKKGFISENDYDECVLSVFNNYSLDKEVADVLVGKWLEENIINK
jgi:hypothetical protein